jgi:pilus assembly protein Flp/PilA
MNTVFARFIKDQSGATAIEYGLIAAIIGVGIITILGLVKGELNTTFGKVNDALKAANGGA